MKLKEIKENEEFVCKGYIFKWQSKGSSLEFVSIRKHDGKVKKVKPEFMPPTLADVTKYFVENGYPKELAKTFFDGYENGEPPWHDSRGNPVRAWKQKAIQVWFKPDAKVKTDQKSFNLQEEL